LSINNAGVNGRHGQPRRQGTRTGNLGQSLSGTQNWTGVWLGSRKGKVWTRRMVAQQRFEKGIIPSVCARSWGLRVCKFRRSIMRFKSRRCADDKRPCPGMGARLLALVMAHYSAVKKRDRSWVFFENRGTQNDNFFRRPAGQAADQAIPNTALGEFPGKTGRALLILGFSEACST